MEKLKRNGYFDNLKGFLILSVIIGNSLELANPPGANIHFVILFLYIFHMPLFAFVSGYFSKLSRRSTKEKVIDTFKIYLFAQAFYVAFIYFIFGDHTIKFELFMPKWTLWYLLSLTTWYLLSDYMKGLKKWIPITIFISLLAGFDKSIGTPLSVSRTLFFLPFFLTGIWFKVEYIEFLKKHKYKILGCSALLLIILACMNGFIPIELFFEYTNYTWYFDKPWFPLIMRIFHFILAYIIGACILSLVSEKKTILRYAGESSLTIYITHSIVANVLIGLSLLKYTSVLMTILSTIIYVIAVLVVTFIYRWKIKSMINK